MYFFNLNSLYENLSPHVIILLCLAVMLMSGFLLTRITKRLHLPNVTAYIVTGILIGPSVLNLIHRNIIENMSFLSDIALSFIAFGVGKFFKKEVIKETGAKIILITLLESLVAGILITLSVKYIFQQSWNLSLLLGAIATATAPASTVMTIKQYDGKGPFVNTLLQIVALDDVVCLFIFSIVVAINSSTANSTVWDVLLPIIYNIGLLLIGAFCGYLLSKILSPKRSKDNRLIIVIAMLLGISGLCGVLGISPLLSCMVFGATYINITYDKELYHQMDNFTPPIMSLFFILSGMNLDLSVLTSVGMIGVAYFLIRIVGKYLGTYLGCKITKMDKKTTNYMGLAMIPQAGVAIGLAFLGQRMLPPDTGNILLTIILASSVLYEIVGPSAAKFALFRSGALKRPKDTKQEKITSENLPDKKIVCATEKTA